jgi:hypothetical protein
VGEVTGLKFQTPKVQIPKKMQTADAGGTLFELNVFWPLDFAIWNL